jgi:tetratricopeptide (TPR) repeat protein
MNLLHMRGYRHAPLSIAKRLYRRGLDYDVPAFAAEALRVLKESVISVKGTIQQFDEYSTDYWTYRAHAEAEERAADCFQRIKLPLRQTKGPQGDLQAHTRQCLQALEPFKGKTPSYLFHVYFYIIRGNYLLETADFSAALDNFDEAIRYFKNKRYPVGNSLAMFYYAKVPACIGLRQYAEGEKAVLASLDHAPNGSHNFFNACEMYFYLAMHAGKYALALELYQTTTRQRRFSNLRPPQRETWHIFGAYIFILYQLKGWAPPENSLPAFRSFRFANETPVYGQDKSGMNVAIQIAFTLLLLLEDRKGDVLERIEALEKYRSRYLHHPGAGRSNLFIRILLQLPKSNFQIPVFQQKIAPLLKELSAAPHRPANQQYELEIIPYETLTGLLLEFLMRGKG